MKRKQPKAVMAWAVLDHIGFHGDAEPLIAMRRSDLSWNKHWRPIYRVRIVPVRRKAMEVRK